MILLKEPHLNDTFGLKGGICGWVFRIDSQSKKISLASAIAQGIYILITKHFWLLSLVTRKALLIPHIVYNFAVGSIADDKEM